MIESIEESFRTLALNLKVGENDDFCCRTDLARTKFLRNKALIVGETLSAFSIVEKWALCRSEVPPPEGFREATLDICFGNVQPYEHT